MRISEGSSPLEKKTTNKQISHTSLKRKEGGSGEHQFGETHLIPQEGAGNHSEVYER